MSYKVEISDQASSDLREIFEHIALHMLSPINAAGQLKRLEDSIETLTELPNRFSEYKSEPWKSRGLRMMPVDNYCVFYFPDEEEHTVYIFRVMYGDRDMQTELNRGMESED